MEVKEMVELLKKDLKILEKEYIENERIMQEECFENKSGIMRCVRGEIIPEFSPHWPGIGTYIGMISTDQGGPKYKICNSSWIYNDTQDYQLNRVYQDELNYFNGDK